MQRTRAGGDIEAKNGRVYVLYMAFPLGIRGRFEKHMRQKSLQPDLFKDLDPQKIIREFLSDYLVVKYDASKHGVFVYPPL